MTMTANPELVTRPAQWSIAIPVEASLKEWNKTIEAIPQLLAWIEEQNIQLASPLFYRYRRMGDMDRPFSVEVGFALEEPVEVSGDVVLSEMEDGVYLVCTHHGHPDGLFDTDAELEQWAADNGISFDVQQHDGAEVWTGRYEFFLTNPDEEPDPSKWEIKLAWLARG